MSTYDRTKYPALILSRPLSELVRRLVRRVDLFG